MATARLSHKRSYDDFLEPYGGFGYNAHAGRNVQAWKPEMMDVMDEVVPAAKKSKFLLHDEESAQSSTPSTQATIAAKISESLPKLTRTDELLNPQTWLKALPRSRRRHHEISGTIGTRNEPAFTLEDVTHMMAAALKAQADSLHVEYQGILGEKVHEVAREYEAEREAEIRSRQQEYSYYS